jgi:type I restriction enzyme S subunit
VTEEEKPYALPRRWEWVRFGNIANIRLGKMLDKSKNKGTHKPYLRNTNVQWYAFDLGDIKEMKFEESELEEFKLHQGVFLSAKEESQNAVPSGTNRHQRCTSKRRFTEPDLSQVSARRQVCLFNDARNGNLKKYFIGATIKHFPGDKLNIYAILLPSVSEQHRIVAKIDQLMALCDSLEQRIEAATTKQSALLDVVVAQTRARKAFLLKDAVTARCGQKINEGGR